MSIYMKIPMAPTGNEKRSDSTHNNALSLFYYLLFLTGFFLLLEISFFISSNSAYLSDFRFVSDQLQIPRAILPGIFYFIGVELLIHLSYCVIIYFLTLSLTNILSVKPDKKMSYAVALWLLGLLTVLLINQYSYPNSKFSELTSIIFFNSTFLTISLGLIGFIWAVVGILVLVDIWRFFITYKRLAFAICIISLSYVLFPVKTIRIQDASTEAQPNIILVGVDSLRPDFLSYFGADKTTPFFDSFLNSATVFSEAVTPLARTFPSWTSILTGQYPRQIGVRFNLANQNQLNLRHSLPAILQKNHYETIYATDETRFSNIDKNYGFDRVITPPMGLNDFLLGTFNDFPLSNLLINTRLGRILFPYSYGNRPVFFAYNPNSFLTMLKDGLPRERHAPLFLAVHFCLPHYPYLWSALRADDYNGQERYEQAVGRVDQQVSDFFQILKEYQLLNHAIVVVLSDHGEALELPGDRITEADSFLTLGKHKSNPPQFYPPSLDDEGINQSAGHGTDVLGLPQYHTLLAFKLYGVGSQQPTLIPGIVSLLDIKPTLLDLLGVKDSAPTTSFAGESLAASIRNTQPGSDPRHIFLESDFTPQAIRTIYPETQKVLLEGIQLFQIDPITTRLTVKESMGDMIIHSKQYADIYGEWMLALYPQSKNVTMPILINLENGKWTNNLHSEFAMHSPAHEMFKALKTFYGSEITNK